MIRIRGEYINFKDLMDTNRGLFYDEIYLLITKNEMSDFHLDVDVENISDRSWKSSIKYGLEDRLGTVVVLKNYYEEIEEYDKCKYLKEYLEKLSIVLV